ncbi:hypothetical protein HK102_005637, partial [Quaeritorhiza haematococci]
MTFSGAYHRHWVKALWSLFTIFNIQNSPLSTIHFLPFLPSTLSTVNYFPCGVYAQPPTNPPPASPNYFIQDPQPTIQGIPTIPKELTDVANPEVAVLEWSKLLGFSLYFFEVQRTGVMPANKRVEWKENSALEDGKDRGVDLSGGYFDAGDHMKFTFPLTMALSDVAWGAIEWFSGYQKANQTRYLDEMLRWGYDWLIKAHPEPNTLYVQVGLAEVDHNVWVPDTKIPNPRPSLVVNASAPGTDVAASAAAAFAAGSIFYSMDTPIRNTQYADTLRSHAVDLYNFAVNATPYTPYSTTVPQAAASYGSNSFGDDLVWAALWMYRLTDDIRYFDEATKFLDEFNLRNIGVAFNWDSKAPGCYVLGAPLALKARGAAGAYWMTQAEQWLDAVEEGACKGCSFTPGGLFWHDLASGPNSLNIAVTSSFLMRMYVSQSNSTINEGVSGDVKRTKYLDFARKQMDYVLGKNPMDMPYIVGVHPNGVQVPHHASASGIEGYGKDWETAPNKYVLYGAIVGGPNKQDSYTDTRKNYEQSE